MQTRRESFLSCGKAERKLLAQGLPLPKHSASYADRENRPGGDAACKAPQKLTYPLCQPFAPARDPKPLRCQPLPLSRSRNSVYLDKSQQLSLLTPINPRFTTQSSKAFCS